MRIVDMRSTISDRQVLSYLADAPNRKVVHGGFMGALDLAFSRSWLVVVVAAMAAAVPAAQSTATPSGQSDDRSSANKKTDPGPVVLTGCVAKGNGPREFTVTDEANGTYRVTG